MSVDSDLHIFDMSMGCIEFNPDKSHSHKGGSRREFLEPEDGNAIALGFNFQYVS